MTVNLQNMGEFNYKLHSDLVSSMSVQMKTPIYVLSRVNIFIRINLNYFYMGYFKWKHKKILTTSITAEIFYSKQYNAIFRSIYNEMTEFML